MGDDGAFEDPRRPHEITTRFPSFVVGLASGPDYPPRGGNSVPSFNMARYAS
jgi:hypothetical protein